VRDGVIAAFEPGDGEVVDARGGAVIPGFVDCHTHLPFAGWRANEYEMKVTGVPYVRAEQEARAEAAERQLARLGKVNPLALAGYDKVLVTRGAVKMLEERLQ